MRRKEIDRAVADRAREIECLKKVHGRQNRFERLISH